MENNILKCVHKVNTQTKEDLEIKALMLPSKLKQQLILLYDPFINFKI